MVTLSPDDLALLNQLQAPLTAPAPAPTPQDFAALQPAALYSQPAPNPDAAYLNSPVPSPSPSDIASVAAMSNPATLGAAPDPQAAGIPPYPQAAAPQVVQGPDGQPMQLPPNTGAANTTAGQPEEHPAYDPTTGKPTKGFRAWINENDLLQDGQAYPQSHIDRLAQIYAEGIMHAKSTPSPQIMTAAGHQYLISGNNTPIQIDRDPKFHQAQLQDGTLGQVDAKTGIFAPFKDGQGNIIKGKLGGMDALAALAQSSQAAPVPPPQQSGWHLPAFLGGSSPSPTPSAIPSPTPYNPGPSVGAGGTPNGVVPISSQSDWQALPPGTRYVLPNGQTGTRLGK